MNKPSLILLAICLILGGGLFLSPPPETLIDTNILSDAIDPEKPELTPYSIVINPKTKTFNENGDLETLIKAKRIKYFNDEDVEEDNQRFSEIEEIEISFYEKKHPWQLHANKGMVIAQNRQTQLTGDVRIWQDDPDAGNTLMKTEALQLNHLKKNASTPEHVTITSVFGNISAKGMQIDFAKEKINLLSSVNGNHDVQHAPKTTPDSRQLN